MDWTITNFNKKIKIPDNTHNCTIPTEFNPFPIQDAAIMIKTVKFSKNVIENIALLK